MEIFLNVSILLFVPLLFFIINAKIQMNVRGGGKCKLFVTFLLFFIIINICTFSISYVRGVRELNFDQMTITYRLKYVAVEIVLGLVSLLISFNCYGTKQFDLHLAGKVRYSNFELLRIVAAGMIILFHYVYGEWDYTYMGHYKVVIDIIWMFGEIGVNIFALLSGYFMIEQEKPRKIKKIFLMWVQVLFYSILSNVIISRMEISEINQNKILQSIFPITYRFRWYATAYFILYIFSPYINRGLKALQKKEYARLIFTFLIIYCIWPTVIGIFNNSTENFLYYNRCLWIVIMYCIAGYIKIYGIYKENLRFIHWVVIHLISWIVLINFIVFIPENGVSEQVKMKNTYFWQPNSILLFVVSISLFMIFTCIKLKENKVITYIASCTFGMYLGQDIILKAFFRKNLSVTKDVFVDMICAFVCIVMGILVIETLRKEFEKIAIRVYDSMRMHG